MPDVSDITGSAVQLAKQKGKSPAARQLKDPKKMAAAGAALMALPFAAEGIAKLASGSPKEAAEDVGRKAKGKAAEGAKKVAGEVADEKLGGAKKLAGLKDLFGGGKGSDSDDGEDATEAHGSGRRMPIQQSVDVAVPIGEAYDQWTRFEEWPKFMHRVDSAQQIDDSTVSISTKVWGVTKQFQAEIVEQRPDERIEWHTEEGLAHSGVVTFHELAPRLTRIEVSMDVKPDSLLEKAGRGMRFTKRAVRGDLHRFKAFVEMEEDTEKGWRGMIEDGDVKRKREKKPGGKSNGSKSRNGSRGKAKAKSR
ncbi:MAG TPA: SRPBCC family protein [Solirubrobacterales bacterium]|nr:SRPBCC family protein [Solirubrobacterales bacterium]